MKTHVKVICAVGIAACLAGVWFSCIHSGQAEGQTQQESKGAKRLRKGGAKNLAKSATQAVREAMTNVVVAKDAVTRSGFRFTNADPILARLKGEDRRLAEALQKDLDGAEFAQVANSATAALRSKDPELRELAVEALGWFGAEALPELTPAMADPNEDVAQAAVNQWEQALSEIEGCSDRLSISAAALGTLTDPTALETIAGQFSNAATEYIDGEEDDEKALEKRVEVVQTLVDMMDESKEGDARTKMAMEAYEDITGNKWQGIGEAEKYLADPDNYEAPDEP